jgi:hypothetical protein
VYLNGPIASNQGAAFIDTLLAEQQITLRAHCFSATQKLGIWGIVWDCLEHLSVHRKVFPIDSRKDVRTVQQIRQRANSLDNDRSSRKTSVARTAVL